MKSLRHEFDQSLEMHDCRVQLYHEGFERAKLGAILLLKDKPMFADKEGHLAVERVENGSDVWL